MNTIISMSFAPSRERIRRAGCRGRGSKFKILEFLTDFSSSTCTVDAPYARLRPPKVLYIQLAHRLSCRLRRSSANAIFSFSLHTLCLIDPRGYVLPLPESSVRRRPQRWSRTKRSAASISKERETEGIPAQRQTPQLSHSGLVQSKQTVRRCEG